MLFPDLLERVGILRVLRRPVGDQQRKPGHAVDCTHHLTRAVGHRHAEIAGPQLHHQPVRLVLLGTENERVFPRHDPRGVLVGEGQPVAHSCSTFRIAGTSTSALNGLTTQAVAPTAFPCRTVSPEDSVVSTKMGVFW